MRHPGRILLSFLVVGAVLAGSMWWEEARRAAADLAAATPAAAPAAPPAVPVEAAQVVVDTVTRAITAIGTLQSSESVILRPEIAGRIMTINFDEGAPIRKGDTLFVLDDSIYRAQANQARAKLELSRKNFSRTEELSRTGASTARQRDESRAQLSVDEANLFHALTMLDKTRIRAPFDGVLGLRNVSVGGYVQPGQDLVNLESIQSLKVRFQVPQTALTTVAVGQTIEVEVDAAPGRSFSGKVQAVDPRVDAAVRSISVQARIPNPDGVLRPGLFVSVRLVVERHENSVLVPEESVFAQGDARYVFRVVEGKARLAEVVLGRRESGRVEIQSGVGPGDTVVIAGQQKLRDGVPVMVIKAAPSNRP